MNFTIHCTVPEYPFRIDHNSPLLSIGSCFANHMAHRLEALKFNIVHNPFGILYNPVSIADALRLVAGTYRFTAADLQQVQGRYVSFRHHSSFAGFDPEQVLAHMNTTLQAAQRQLPSCSLLILTLGSAYVWRRIEDDQIVANCHKLPSKAFRRERLSVDQLTTYLGSALGELLDKQPHLQVLLTVSPVRHTREGLIANQRSKAALHLCVDTLQARLERLQYFPSYEILIDELRNYRFYERDMVHPSPLAVDYIFEAFAQQCMSEGARRLNGEIQKVRRAQRHEPFHPDSLAHQQFLQKQLQHLEQLSSLHPGLDWEKEKEPFRNALRSIGY